MFLAILRNEFLLISRNLSKIIQNFLFFFISFAVFFLLSQNQQNQTLEPYLIVNVILFCLTFNLIISNSDFLSEDFRDGTLEQMIISQPNLEIFVLAKMLANWLIFSLPILIAIFPMALLLGFDPNNIYYFLIILSLASIVINFICAFCGSLSIVKNKAPMIAILALPLIIPTLLFACTDSFFSENFNSDEFYQILKILAGIVVLSGSMSILGTAKIVKIVAE
ncbi:MAG: heme exporter protein CcmB [Rickettsiales bacterium]|nr:heme exporter protein CcmB [Rickettsiales bacterium]